MMFIFILYSRKVYEFYILIISILKMTKVKLWCVCKCEQGHIASNWRSQNLILIGLAPKSILLTIVFIVARIKQKQNKPRGYFFITSNLLQEYVIKGSFSVNIDPQRLVYISQPIRTSMLEEIFNPKYWNIKLLIFYPSFILKVIQEVFLEGKQCNLLCGKKIQTSSWDTCIQVSVLPSICYVILGKSLLSIGFSFVIFNWRNLH